MSRWSLAAASAALLAVASRPWPATGYLAFVAVVPLLLALRGERHPLRAAGYAALAWSGFGWVVYEGALVVEPWSFPVLVVGSSLLWALAAAAAVSVAQRWGDRAAVAWFPAFVVAVEYVAAQSPLFGAYAFVGAFAYAQHDTVLQAAAAWSGVGGVGAVVLASNAAVALARRGPTSPRTVATWVAGPAVALFVAALPVPGVTPRPGDDSIRIAMVQGAVPRADVQMAFLDASASARVLEVFAAATRRAAAEGAEWVVWGETVVPYDFVDGRAAVEVTAALEPAQVAFVGSRERVGAQRHNAVLAWRGGALESVYRKNVLVPFIEDVFTPGDGLALVEVDGVSVALGICLESLYGDRARAATAAGADVLLYVSDDTFAGRTVTPVLHAGIAGFRAAEAGRPVVFVNESGPSVAFDARGRRLGRLPWGASDVLLVDLPLAAGTTPFVRYGDWVGRLALSLAVAACATAVLPARWRGRRGPGADPPVRGMRR